MGIMQDVLCFDITTSKQSELQHGFIAKLYVVSLVKHVGGGEREQAIVNSYKKYRKLLLSILTSVKLLRLSRWGNRK